MEKKQEDQIKLEAMYSNMAKHGDFICKEWFRLVIDSLKDLENRELRQKLLKHPYDCKHPSCTATADFMVELFKK
jgi:hypothetical protein